MLVHERQGLTAAQADMRAAIEKLEAENKGLQEKCKDAEVCTDMQVCLGVSVLQWCIQHGVKCMALRGIQR